MKTRLIIFDLDGTLVDCRELHYEALNKALDEVIGRPISREEHVSKYDGLNTYSKLFMHKVPSHLQEVVFDKKQEYTVKMIDDIIKPDERISNVLHDLKYRNPNHQIKIAVASNSIRKTVKLLLNKIGCEPWIGAAYSNQDVYFKKPNPSMYLLAMSQAGCSPFETLIVEDSDIGIQGATLTAAKVLRVKDSSEVTYENIMKHVEA